MTTSWLRHHDGEDLGLDEGAVRWRECSAYLRGSGGSTRSEGYSSFYCPKSLRGIDFGQHQRRFVVRKQAVEHTRWPCNERCGLSLTQEAGIG